jgi:hypothetical protein
LEAFAGLSGELKPTGGGADNFKTLKEGEEAREWRLPLFPELILSFKSVWMMVPAGKGSLYRKVAAPSESKLGNLGERRKSNAFWFKTYIMVSEKSI